MKFYLVVNSGVPIGLYTCITDALGICLDTSGCKVYECRLNGVGMNEVCLAKKYL